MQYKKIILIIAGLVLFVVIGLTIFKFVISPESTDLKIRESLRCNRLTTEYLVTDYYCDNPQDYRKDLKNNDLLKNDWPYEYAQQELQRRGYDN